MCWVGGSWLSCCIRCSSARSSLLLLMTGWQYQSPCCISSSWAPHRMHLLCARCPIWLRCFPTQPAPVANCCRMLVWLGGWCRSAAFSVAWSMDVAGCMWCLCLISLLNLAFCAKCATCPARCCPAIFMMFAIVCLLSVLLLLCCDCG